MSIVQDKKKLRASLKKRRDLIAPSFKQQYDNAICAALEELITLKNCQVVHAYLPMESEIDIRPLLARLLKKNITVIIAKTLVNRKLEHLVLDSLNAVESGLYGTTHPRNGLVFNGEIDLIIVPGLAFDNQNYRLGYGGGYYDTFLASFKKSFTVGVAYPFQHISVVPKEMHDACLDQIMVL